MEHMFISNSLYILLLAFTGIVLLVMKKLYSKYQTYLRRFKDLPTFKGLSFLGYYNVMKKFSSNTLIPPECYSFQLGCALSHLYSKGFFVLWVIFKPFIIVYKAEIMKELICHPSAIEKPKEYDVMKFYFGSGLITSNGYIWSNHRKVATPAFHLKVLKEYISVFNEQANVLIHRLKDLANEPWIDIAKYIEACTFDIICKTTMGTNFGCQAGNEKAKMCVRAIDELENISTYRMIRPWTHFDFLLSFFATGRKMQRITNVFMKYLDENFQKQWESHELRKKEEDANKVKKMSLDKRRTFAGMLFDYHDENPSFTLKEIKDEVFTILSAGHDTAAMALRWTLLLLGLHPDEQENLIQELDSVFENKWNGTVSYEELNDLMYMDCVIKESMRLYPPVPIIARKLSEDVHVGKYTLPGGCVLLFYIYMLHRDPEQFPEPEIFRPERFFPENVSNFNSFAYLPFSAGPRNCIGQKFAMIEVKTLLCHIFWNFRVKSLQHRDKININWGVSLKNVDPIKICLIPRHH